MYAVVYPLETNSGADLVLLPQFTSSHGYRTQSRQSSEEEEQGSSR